MAQESSPSATPPAIQPSLPTKPDPALVNLGQDFATKIGGTLKQTELFLKGAGKLELAEQKSGSIIPEDEPLLLHAVIGKDRVNGTQDIYSIKKNHRLMISLSDFASATGLAIKVQSAAGTASGWFVKPDQTFSLDVTKGQAVIQGKAVPVIPDDIDSSGSDLMVSSEQLEKWFGLSFDYDFSALNLIIKTVQPLPAEEAYARSQKTTGQFSNQTKAKLPYQEVPYSLLTQPYIDTSINANLIHTPKAGPIKTETWSTLFSGDVAGLNANGYVSGSQTQPSDKENAVDTVRITLGKDDPEGKLLGPLHATSYRLGDIDTVSNAMIGGGQLEQGVRISNQDLDSTTSQTATQIKGDSQPGWDIELYRNNSYIDIRHVGVDGRYDFGDVDLVVGDNDFKLLFFGPQGEAREEHKHVSVNASDLGLSKGKYAVSLSRSNKTTWERIPSTVPEAGDMRFAAHYERGLGELGTGNLGLTHNDDGGGAYRTFAQAGLASYLLGAFLNTDVGVDTGTGDYSTRFSARRNFGAQSTLFQYTKNSKGYNANSIIGGAFLKDSYRGSLSGPITDKIYIVNRPSYSLDGGYVENYNGSTTLSAAASLTGGIESILFSGSLSYTKNTTLVVGENIGNFASGGDSSTTDATFNVRGPFMGGILRTTSQYSVKPETKLKQSNMSYDRQISPNLSSTTTLNYVPKPKLYDLSVGLNWQTPYATISPNAGIDSNRNANIGVDLHFGTGADPFTHKYQIYNQALSDSGGVAARIFLDKNGNGIYDKDEELLPDAELSAIQGGQSAASDKDGIAYIPNLQKNQLTDIVVNASSSADAYGISLFEGVSIRPHPGAVTQLEFPIVEAGELDGQAYVLDEKNVSSPARDMQLSLVRADGKVEKSAKTASDGYWSMSVIRPGTYYLTADGDSDNPGYFVPRMIQFKQDGTNLFGQDVKLVPGQTVGYKFTSDNPPPDGPKHARVLRPEDIVSQRTLVELGPYHSRLAMTLSWYRIRMRMGSWSNGFDLATSIGDTPVDPKNGTMILSMKPRTPLNIAQATAACQSLHDIKVGCGVHVITTYRVLKQDGTTSFPEPIVAETKIAKPAPQMVANAPIAAKTLPQPVTATQPDIIVRPSSAQNAITTMSPEVLADLSDYVAINPTLDKSALKNKTVILNLGSYNSRPLMAVIWYKLKTHYGAMIGDARLLVQPTQSNASLQTGKYTLRASMPTYDVEDANKRCQQLVAAGQACTVEVLPSGLQASR